MIRNPNFSDRQDRSPAWWAEELIRLRDLITQVDEYGGIDRLRTDIRTLERELVTDSGIHRWKHLP
jgi:hypothetical protein